MVQAILLFYNGKCRWFKYIEQMSPDIYRDENWTIIFFQSVFSLYLCGFSGGGSANHLIWKPNTSSQYEFQRGGIALLRIDWW
jgi:hypothetical protein